MRYEIETRVVAEQPTAIIRGHVSEESIGAWLAGAYAEVFGCLADAGVAPAGPPFVRYTFVPDGFDVEAGVPVGSPVLVVGRVEASSLPAGRVATTLHVGPYQDLAAAHDAVEAWIREHGFEPAGPHWEFYLSEPTVAPEDQRTEVVEPYRAA